MSKDDVIQMQGEILENLPNAMFRVYWITGTKFSATSPER